jgi:hypothetical protein
MRDILTDTPRTGIHYGMGWDEYRAIRALNPSVIVACDQSPLHVQAAMNGGRKDTDSLAWGRLLHSAVLEPGTVRSRYSLPTPNKSGGLVRTAKQKAAAAERGVELVLPQQLDALTLAAKHVVECKDLSPFVPTKQAEVVVLSSECGCQVKGRLDWVSADPLAIIDVKTARTIDARKFSRDFYALHYDVKLGLYRHWLQRLTKAREIPVYLFLVENAEPFDCQLVPRCDGKAHPIPAAVLDRGADKGLRWIAQIAECIRSDRWPGTAAQGDWVLDTPSWEMDEDIEPEITLDE